MKDAVVADVGDECVKVKAMLLAQLLDLQLVGWTIGVR
jgi:hypothetical protein